MLTFRTSVFALFAVLYSSAPSLAHDPRAPSEPSPSVDSNSLICHSGECYPKVFSPTLQFQPVHDDQSLPPGLHVRLDLQTGRKEARLSGPHSDNVGADSGSPEDGLVSVVDGGGGDQLTGDQSQTRKSMVERQGKQPPAHSNVGRIRTPTDESEAELFASSVEVLLSPIANERVGVVLQALEDLEELAHELYYGVEVARNTKLLHSLLRLSDEADEDRVRGMASLVLGSAVQNNPSALEELKVFPVNLPKRILGLLEKENTPKVQERLMYLLSNVVRGVGQLDSFVDANGLGRLVKFFDAEGSGSDGRDGVRGRCATFVTDNFLNEDMRREVHWRPATDEGHTQAGQAVLGRAATTGQLGEWCEAFRVSSKRLKDVKLESSVAHDKIEEALTFAPCR